MKKVPKTKIPPKLGEDVRKRLMGYPHVTDVGLGVKMKDGKFTSDTAIVVYVDKKLPRNELAAGSLIPAKIKGLPTDVQEELDPAFFQLNDTTGFNLTRVRPLRSGICVSTASAPDHGGTLGVFATRNSDQKKVLVSNYHVLFRDMGFALPGEEVNKVYQPLNEEANLVAKVPETGGGTIGGEVDCAYAVLEEEGSSCCCKHVIAHENKVGTTALTGVATAVKEQKVFKTGIATGATVGRIVNTSKAITGAVDYSEYNLPAGDSFTFSNLIMIVYWDEDADDYDDTKEFSSGGDSGSAIYNEDNEIVGIHFGSHHNPATGKYFSFACHIELVENELGVTVPGNRSNLVAVVQPPSSPEVAALDIPINSSDGGFAVAGSQASPKDEEPDLWPTFRDHLQKTELGRTALGIIDLHGFEIMRLINRNREVTVTWHRRKGPSFTAAIARSVKHPDYRIPTEIEGQTFAELLSQMGIVLYRHGSPELRKIVDEYLPLLLRMAGNLGADVSFSEILEWLETDRIYQQNQVNG